MMRATVALALSTLAGSAPLPAASLDFDVIVYGATPGGIAAAVTAANGTGLRVALIEPTPFVGGMAGPGGIGLRDICSGSATGDERTAMHTWLHYNAEAYNVSGTVWQPDEYIGEANWWRLLSLPALGISVFTQTGIFEGPTPIGMSGTRIAWLLTVNTSSGSSGAVTNWTARAFVDASYEADLVVGTGVISYTYGRESHDTYNESLAGVQPQGSFAQFQVPVNPYWSNGTLLFGVDAGPLPPVGSADQRLMPMSFRLCVTTDANNSVPVPAPDGYNPGDFELLRRYTQALNQQKPSGPSLQDLVATYDYNGYPAGGSRSMRYDLCESGGSAVSTDEPTAIYDAYVTGNRSVRAAVIQRVKYWVAGFMYTLANDPDVPAVTRESASRWGLCADAWPQNGHWPPLVYVREGVRIIGDVVSTQVNTVKGVCVPTAVGIGGWTIDVHIMNRVVGNISGTISAVNEGAIGFAPLPGNGSAYEMPYSMLLPKKAECTNLLVPVTPSVSHIAFASVRVEPTFMQLGTAAGAAAALVAQTGSNAQDIPIRTLQAAITNAGQCVHYGSAPSDCYNTTLC